MKIPSPARKQSRASVRPRTGLLYWARQANEQLGKAADGLHADPVHDLRVAIRRCRSLAEGLRSVDPAPGWKQFRSLPKPLFAALGELRDTQVLQQWLTSLATERDPARAVLSKVLSAREADQKDAAQEALRDFNGRRWLKVANELDQRARKLRPGSRVFQHLALERWIEAQRLHEVAIRSQDALDLHQLRIAIKRFRYTVENFLPDLHRRWGKDLKRVQDLLGEVHDLDVLMAELRQSSTAPAHRERFAARVSRARSQRIAEYLSRTTGATSLWEEWRAALPSGRELPAAASAKLRQWSRALDRDPAHSERVARIGAQLWRELRRALDWPFDRRSTVLLRSAALFHSVGEHKPQRKAQLFRAKMMGRLAVPVGWTEDEMHIVRLASQYCRGPLPSTTNPEIAALSETERQRLTRMAGVLRLADALSSGSTLARLAAVTRSNGYITIGIAGFEPVGEQALAIAAARYALELSEGIPFVISPAAADSIATKSARTAAN